MSRKYDPAKPMRDNVLVAMYGPCATSPLLPLATWADRNLRLIPGAALTPGTREKIMGEIAEAAAQAIAEGNSGFFREFADCLDAVKGKPKGGYDKERTWVFYCFDRLTKTLGREPTKGELYAEVKSVVKYRIQPAQWTRILKSYGLDRLKKTSRETK